MNIKKRFLTTMNRCYSATHIEVDGQTRILLATEGEGPCLAWTFLLYTSDASDDLLCVDLGGRRIIQKKQHNNTAALTH